MTEQTTTTPSAESVTVRGGPAGFSRQASSVSELSDSDIVKVDGMDVTVQVARDLGLLGQVFGEAPQGNAETHAATPEISDAPKSDTGFADYDQAVDSLNELVEQREMTGQEAQVYDTSLAQVAMAGLQVDEMVNTVNGLADGSISEQDVPSDVRMLATAVETNVRQASEQAALSELGQDTYDYLSTLMATNASVAGIVQRYAVDRMQGKHEGYSWSELYRDLYNDLGL